MIRLTHLFIAAQYAAATGFIAGGLLNTVPMLYFCTSKFKYRQIELNEAAKAMCFAWAALACLKKGIEIGKKAKATGTTNRQQFFQNRQRTKARTTLLFSAVIGAYLYGGWQSVALTLFYLTLHVGLNAPNPVEDILMAVCFKRNTPA